MNNDRHIPVHQQIAMQRARQRRLNDLREKRSKARRRSRLLRKLAVLSATGLIAALLVFLVCKFVSYTISSISEKTSPGTEPPTEQQDTTPSGTGTDIPENPNPASATPDAANPVTDGDYIYLNKFADEVLPETYSTKGYRFYDGFENDNPALTLTDGITIVIDAGHQPETRLSSVWLSPYIDPDLESSWVMKSLLDIGTTGVATKTCEYTVTHAVAAKLKTALEAEGYTVILSHPDLEEKISGAERAAVANKNNADLMISLHCDSYNKDSSVGGASALIPEIWDGYPSERLAYLSKAAADVILDEYTDSTGLKNRGTFPVTKTSMFSFCKIPILLLEMGFMSNPTEDKKLCSDSFQDKIVEGLVNGINRYFRLLKE